MNLKKNIAIIPARGGSKRLPNKNIKDLDGIPLLVYSINYALANTAIVSDVYVSTDSEAIKKVALKHGAKVIDRPKELSGDLEPTLSTLEHALSIINDVDNIILLQPTNPLRPANLLNEAYTTFVENKAESVFTVSKHHKKLGKLKENKFVPYNYTIGQRSQDLEHLYYENGLLYITSAQLIKKGMIFNENSYPIIVNHKFAEIDIDTQEDFDFAEFILNRYNE